MTHVVRRQKHDAGRDEGRPHTEKLAGTDLRPFGVFPRRQAL